VADGADDSSVTRIAEGGDLVNKGVGSVAPSSGGGLLTTNELHPRHGRQPPGRGSQRLRAPRRRQRPDRVTTKTTSSHNDAPHHWDVRQFAHHIQWIFRDQPQGHNQVRAERNAESIRVHHVDNLGHVELPPTPALLLDDDGDDHIDHWDNPG
jgi:hypothetical protein